MTESKKANVRIAFENPPKFKDSQWLEGRRSELQREYGIPCELEFADNPDDISMGEPVTAIAIAGLSLAIFDRILQLLKYHRESQNKITVTEENGISWTRTYGTDEEREEILDIIRQKNVKNIDFTVCN